MLCEKCKKNQAAVYLQQIINGEKTGMRLCQSCAAEAVIPISFNDIFQGFLDSFSHFTNEANGQGFYKKDLQCSACGLHYEEFKKTGRLGCEGCYSAFSSELDAIFKNVQASNQHQGKFPQKYGSELWAKKEMEKCKLMLSKAIENEEYEEAAKYRDMIRELQKH